VQAVYQGVLMSGVAIFTFNRTVALLGSSAATAIIALLPAVASLIAIPVLGERPAPIERVAIAIIIGGVLLATRRPSKPEATGPERRVT
jgi:drug/metabolite transporter (DMT)-like permease